MPRGGFVQLTGEVGTGKTTRRFEDHTKDVMSVAFSADNRQVRNSKSFQQIKLLFGRPQNEFIRHYF